MEFYLLHTALGTREESGRTYRWESNEYAYEEFACGWDGEKWEDAHE